jgi:hypothetical protein
MAKLGEPATLATLAVEVRGRESWLEQAVGEAARQRVALPLEALHLLGGREAALENF